MGHPGQPWFMVLLSQTQAVSQDSEEVQYSGTGSGIQTSPGAEKKEGKTQEKTNPLLWLLLLMRSRTLPKPEGTEGRLSRAPLSPFRAGWGLRQTIERAPRQSTAGCCSSEALFLESSDADGHGVSSAAEISGGGTGMSCQSREV